MTMTEFDPNRFSYSIKEVAEEVTILPWDDEAAIFRKRASHFVIEGNPEAVASQVQNTIDQVGIEIARQLLISPESFSRLLLLIAHEHSIMHTLETEERPLRLALYKGAEAIVTDANLRLGEKMINLTLDTRSELADVIHLQTLIATVTSIKNKLVARPFSLRGAVPPEF